MPGLIDLTGKEFGTLRVKERAPSQSANPRKIRSAYWLVTCSNCGRVFAIRTDNLRRGAVKCPCQGPTCLRPRKVADGEIGARYTDPRGYVRVWAPWHANADKQGWVLEHRLFMSLHLERPLTEDEVVHHVNGKRDDNRLDNLLLFPNQVEHVKYEKANGLRGQKAREAAAAF